MNQIALILFAVLACSLPGSSKEPVHAPPEFTIQRPTVIAFFPVTQAEVDSDSDTSEALGDFDYYIEQARGRLEKAGIEVHVVNERSFRVRFGARVRLFPRGNARDGYYFFQPGKEPHVVYDVMTDSDLIDSVRKYFGTAIP